MADNNNLNESSEVRQLPARLPLFLSNDMVVFPGVVTPMEIAEPGQVIMVNEVLSQDNKMMVMALKKPGNDEGVRSNEPYDVGCIAIIVRMLRIPDGTLRLLVQGLSRTRIDSVFETEEGHREVTVTPLVARPVEGVRIEALIRKVRENFTTIIDNSQNLPDELKIALNNISDAGAMADFVASNLNIKPDERQDVLEAIEIDRRMDRLGKLLSRELQIIRVGSKIHTEVSGAIEKNQREYFLREQLKVIRKELGEDEDVGRIELQELQKKLSELDAPDRVKEIATKEIDRLGRMNPASSEYTVSRTYIDWILDLPWHISTEDRLNIKEARLILDRDHYGLEDVKERILEYLAVKKLRGGGKGSIICFVGPPGVGKTSIGISIASAMGRKFCRMSLGGLRDEAEIRGHRRTYIGALPGRIIQNIKKVGSNNPVFMLDEIDKLGSDFRGDPASAMLEVLDPAQNIAFQDNYMELDFDLSNVMFITTANYLETIPPPLRDRMEIIKLPGYITPEKVQIARNYLVPRQIEENGLSRKLISFTDSALERMVVFYTREAGVRTLERTIGKVCRKVAVTVASSSKKPSKKFSITARNLKEYLGSPKVMPDLWRRSPTVGVATGLAWTPVGGAILVIEAIAMPGDGKMKVTGQLGDVMKESMEIARSWLRSEANKLGIPADWFNTHDVHVHVPEGATPKDGPSAGITITTALASLFTGRPVRHDIAMTGEITLEGRVLPIGGLREKAVAAARGHMSKVLCPADNKGDMEDIPDIVKEKVEFVFVDKLEDVLKLTLLPNALKNK